jgi:hypothetical protein
MTDGSHFVIDNCFFGLYYLHRWRYLSLIIESLVFITFIGGAEGHDNHPHEEVGHSQGGDEVVRS